MNESTDKEWMRKTIDGYLDGTLSARESDDLNRWIKENPDNALAFGRRVRLHDSLRQVVADAAWVPTPQKGSFGNKKKFRRLQLVGALSVAAVLALWAFLSQPVSAAREMERLIRVSSAELAQKDRTYRILNLEDYPEEEGEKKPPIDGALLHVRSPDQYVLIRRFSDGREWVTGSDGESGWSIPPEGSGAVRVSADPMRFRGPVPGHQAGIPFANLSADLTRIRLTYDLMVLPVSTDGRRGLLAQKRSVQDRGPREVEIRYDANSGVIYRMTFLGMPQAKGGPNHLKVELVDQKPLGPDFFKHNQHHVQNRKVILED